MTRYEIRPDLNGWTVYDTATDMPVEVNGFVQDCLSLEDADDLVDLLNRLHIEQLASTPH